MTEILCRVDTAKKQPVVFIPHSIDNNNIIAWINGAEQIVSLDYYHSTGPLSAADEEVLRKRYAAATGNTFVKARHRLPRVPRILENILAKPPKAAPVATVPAPVATPAPTPAPAPAARKRPTAKKKAAKRRPAAKPADVAAPVVQATPNDVLQAIEAARADFAARMESIMQTLTPKV